MINSKTIIVRRGALIAERTSLVQYLRSKVEAKDWHAVQDAASDIREINARLEELRDASEAE